MCFHSLLGHNSLEICNQLPLASLAPQLGAMDASPVRDYVLCGHLQIVQAILRTRPEVIDAASKTIAVDDARGSEALLLFLLRQCLFTNIGGRPEANLEGESLDTRMKALVMFNATVVRNHYH